MSLRRGVLIAALWLALAPATAAEPTLAPADEGATNTSWVHFRNRLIDALATRDRKFLLSVIAPNVRNSMDAPPGIAEFRKRWEIESDTSPLWSELASALFLGSAWLKRGNEARQLCAPYVAVKWPDDIDPAFHGAVTAGDALLKSEPSHGSETLATLAYRIVRVADWEVADAEPGAAQKWVKVRTAGHEGFLPEEQIRSPVEHRACFVPTEHGWRMTSFVLGIQK